MPVIHELKCLPNYFDAAERGEKPFEVRRDDRGFQKGDILRLFRWDEARGYASGAKGSTRREPIEREITFVLTGGQFGIEPGFVVLGVIPVKEASNG